MLILLVSESLRLEQFSDVMDITDAEADLENSKGNRRKSNKAIAMD